MTGLLDFGPGETSNQQNKVFCFVLVATGALLSCKLASHAGSGAVRAKASALCALIFVPRFALMLFYLSSRTVPAWEAAATGLGMLVVQPLFVTACERAPRRRDWILFIALSLYVLGSVTNTTAELQRKWWKEQQPLGNPRVLYVEGLFGLARHINYGAEVLIFIGWAALCLPRRRWPLLVPTFFFLSFVFFYIPAQDDHLRRTYGDAVVDQQIAQVPYSIIPLVY